MAQLELYGIYHKPHPLPKYNEWMIPVAVGDYAAQAQQSGFLTDNTGRNISHLNRYYCELTVQYWVRHNRKSEYVGFYHYRRFMSFLNVSNVLVPVASISPSEVIYDYLSSASQLEAACDLINLCDIVIPFAPPEKRSINDLYLGCHAELPWRVFLDVISGTEYSKYANIYKISRNITCWNMYVMRWDDFVDYIDQLFYVIDKVVGIVGFPFDENNNRYPGFLAERFLILYLLARKKVYLQRQMILVE